MSDEVDPDLARLKRLPPRLRVAHLAALLRSERTANAGARSPSDPSRREAVGRDGRCVAEARVGGILLYPYPAHRSPRLTMIHLESELARLGPRKGEGSDLSNGLCTDGHLG